MESRRPINFGLRVLTAAVVVTVFAIFIATSDLDASEIGPELFQALALGLGLAIWIIVPLMTADCISREKREGTLGLLFLTPLTVLDVILGKAASHILRAATLLLASVPVLLLPFVMGGVSAQQVVMAVARLTTALLLGIAAGLFASARGGSVIQVMMTAEGSALALACVVGFAQGISSVAWEQTIGGSLLGAVLEAATNVALAFGMFLLAVGSSSRVLRKSWSRDAATPEQPKWVILFSGSEFWRTLFHWERGRTLDRNPMAWLQEYSWTARLTKWGWCIIVLAAELFALAVPSGQAYLTMALSLGVAFSAAGSFRRERQSGVLEILLVTPLSARQLMTGRLWGIFCHFIPALGVLWVCWYAEWLIFRVEFREDALWLVVPTPVGFGALMMVGLYLSVWRLNFLVAWLLAWALAFSVPAFAVVVLRRFDILSVGQSFAIISSFQVLLAVTCWFLLHRNLKQRRFIRADAV